MVNKNKRVARALHKINKPTTNRHIN